MEREIFTDQNVKSALENYRPLFIDVTDHPQLAKSFQVETLPTMLLFDQGTLTTRRVGGFNDAKAFASFLSGARNICQLTNSDADGVNVGIEE